MGDNKELKVDSLIREINETIRPKKEKFVLDDIEVLEETIELLITDKELHKIALKKYHSKIKIFEYAFKNEMILIDLQSKILDGKITDTDFELEIPDIFNDDELVMINYLYNLILNAFLQDKTINLKVYPKSIEESKTKCLQKK